MVTPWRPADGFDSYFGFIASRERAYRDGYCRRCGVDINPSVMTPEERTNWRTDALCPLCLAHLADLGDDCNE